MFLVSLRGCSSIVRSALYVAVFMLICASATIQPVMGQITATGDPNRPDVKGAAQGPPPSSAVQSLPKPQPTPKPPVHILRMPESGASAPPLAAVVGAHATYFGGPIISNVHVVQVLYGTGAYLPAVSSTAAPSIASFYTDLTQSSFFDVLSEYSTVGVNAFDGTLGSNQALGHGFFDGEFTITPAAANNGAVITDAQIQTELLGQVSAGNLPAPVFDVQGNNNTVYMIFFPPGKTITLGTISSCVSGGFCAYHNSTTGTFASHRLYYGVHPDVQPPSLCSTGCGPTSNPFQINTVVTSHELAEAVTDPDVGPANSFARPLAWTDTENGEIGDICRGATSFLTLSSGGYLVQKQFSNAQDDCAAGPGQFSLAVPPFVVKSGQLFDLDVSAVSDSSINIATYTGTVHFTSNDPGAVLPADYTFSSADAGHHTFVASLKALGSQTITAADTKGSLLPGTTQVTVVPEVTVGLAIALPGNTTQGVAFPVVVMARTLDLNNIGRPSPGYNGTVHFTSSDPGAVLPADGPVTNGIGTFSVTFKTGGQLQILDVTDTANANLFGQGTSTVATTAVNPTATSLAAVGPLVSVQMSTFIVTVTQGTSPVTAGNVNISVDGQVLAGALVDATGHSQIQFSMAGGPHVLFADYGGSGLFPPSSSGPLSIMVSGAPTTLTLSTGASPSTVDQQVSFTAHVASPGAFFGVDGGFITFMDGGVPIAVLPVAFGGNTLTFPASLSVGSHSISASYSGAADFAASVANPLVQVVLPAPPADYSIAADRLSATVLAGQSAGFVIKAQSLNGFSGTVNFLCSGLPVSASCTFTPAQAVVNGPSAFELVGLTVKTPGPNALLSAPNRGHRLNAFNLGVGTFAFAVVLLAGAGADRRRYRRVFPLVMLVLLLGIASCGGGGGTSQTQQQPNISSFNVTVSATGVGASGSKATNPTQQLNISITVVQ